MNDRDQRRYDRATRVQTFGRENKGDFAAGSKAAANFKTLDAIIEDIGEAKVGQIRTPVSKETLLDALTLDFKNIARTARAIEQDEPGFAGPYRIPDNPSESAIVTHADTLLKLLEDNDAPVAEGEDTPAQKAAKATLRAKFIAYEMPEDFIQDLRADREAIRTANQNKGADNLEGVENTAAIGTLLGKAQEVITHLDAVMHNKYVRNPDKLRAWQSASHVERAPQRGKKNGGGTQPTGWGSVTLPE